jgi:hypothetical protein
MVITRYCGNSRVRLSPPESSHGDLQTSLGASTPDRTGTKKPSDQSSSIKSIQSQVVVIGID